MKQTDSVLALLREKGEVGVTPLEALERVGTLRLGARIWDLRKEGHLIVSDRLTFGQGERRKTVARYVLIDFEPPAPGQATIWEGTP